MLTYGGIITEISTPDRKGEAVNVVLALPISKRMRRANFSSLLGRRYANRIADGGFMLDGVRYNLPSNAQGISSHGYPGKLAVSVQFLLSDALQIRYSARTDQPTVVNLSDHVYFNLAGEGTIVAQSLQASQIVTHRLMRARFQQAGRYFERPPNTGSV